MTPIQQMIQEIHDDLREINSKLDDLNTWRWKVTGMSLATSVIIGLGFEIFKTFVLK